MDQLLSRSQASEFVRLEGLHKLTGVAAYDWDFYILKELVDNALDADENDPNVATPQIHVVMTYNMEYVEATGQSERALFVEVRNQARFPLERITDLFDLGQRFSVKDYFKYPTRGAQGNALKTILGIPYALRYHYFTDYHPKSTPLSIAYGHDRVTLELEVDELNQTVKLKPELHHDSDGRRETTISVNVERFTQDPPRTMEQLLDMAESLALFNPHATFSFEFAFTERDRYGDYHDTYETRAYDGDPAWGGKFNREQRSPIFWYRQDKFRELVFALIRAEQAEKQCTIQDLAEVFGLAKLPLRGDFRPDIPLRLLMQRADLLNRLFGVWHEQAEASAPVHLGEIGGSHFLKRSLLPETDGKPPLFFHRRHHVTDPRTPLPFTLEVALCANTNGKRRVITGINHTPTYSDPFYNKPLKPPNTDVECKSLEKLLDHYDLREEAAITLTVHLIAPNLEYESYGKNAISDKPYRAALTRLVDEVVAEYKEATRPPDPVDYLSEPARQALPAVIAELKGSDFSLMQLIYTLWRKLLALHNADITTDLQSADAVSRLQRVIDQYQNTQPIPGLHRRQSGRLAVPRHPTDTINIAFSHLNVLDVVRDYHIRAIIVTNAAALEEVLIASRYPLLYDVAILRADGNLSSALETLVNRYQPILTNENPEDDALLPQIWLVRDCSVEAFQQTRVAVRDAFHKANLTFDRVIDFGLHPDAAEQFALPTRKQAEDRAPLDRHALRQQGFSNAEIAYFADEGASASLETLSPTLLKAWFEGQLDALNLPHKALPQMPYVTRAALSELQQRLRDVIADAAFDVYKLDEQVRRIVERWQMDKPEWDTDLYSDLAVLLQSNPTESWFTGLEGAIKQMLRLYLTPQRRGQIKQMMSE